jgi:hypothetical protein
MSDTPALQMIEPVRSRYAEAARSRSHGYSYGGSEMTLTFSPAYRCPETSPNAEANGRKTKLIRHIQLGCMFRHPVPGRCTVGQDNRIRCSRSRQRRISAGIAAWR